MSHFVFCHGFGFDNNFWNQISCYFSQEHCSYLNRGYFANPISYQHLEGHEIIGIGHSLGLANLLTMNIKFKYLIGLNSFSNFLGSNPKVRKQRLIALRSIRKNLLINPYATLQHFYRNCGAAELSNNIDKQQLNLPLLLSDLRSLEHTHYLPNIPTLILSSNDDIIVPTAIINDNFQGSSVYLDSVCHAGHALGFKAAQPVYAKIMSFLNDHCT